jgi:isoquinoline 1-oxidoreductase
MGGAGLLYAFRWVPSAHAQSELPDDRILELEDVECAVMDMGIDYGDWIAFTPDGKVSVFTGRTELGQGLKTVITALVTQALEIPKNRLTVVMGDTDLCPDDGSTTGSSATKLVGWGFWQACLRIRGDLEQRAAQSLGYDRERLSYRSGGVGLKDRPGLAYRAHELGKGQAVLMSLDPAESSSSGASYVDYGIPNVHALKIVTGKLKFVGDIRIPGTLYADWLPPPYHPGITRITSMNLTAARAVPGIRLVRQVRDGVIAVGRRYRDVTRALDTAQVWWKPPSRPRSLDVEAEIRERARLKEIKERQGDVDLGLASSDLVVSETYLTQYATQAPIETDTALAQPSKTAAGKKRMTVYVSSQWPYKARELAARYLGIDESSVRIVGMPVGGGFGGKISNPVAAEAALVADLVRAPVKLLYSRRNQFQLRGAFKAACLIDITTGVSADGRIQARRIDTHMDVGNGTTDTYAIPHVLTQLYEAKWPFRRAISRGTSYVQNCFATESHIDMVAAAVGMDPWEFRRKNVRHPEFLPLIDACAEMIGVEGGTSPAPDAGIGLAIINHGAQLGAVAAHVRVNRDSGRVEVKRLCGAFDIGTIVNHRTATVGIRGAMIWGIGYALSEEVSLDGHSCWTTTLTQYGIPRFSDTPPIEIAFRDNYAPGGPRGCGEMPLVPTIGAIANAVHQAVGIRFYSTPINPAKVKSVL